MSHLALVAPSIPRVTTSTGFFKSYQTEMFAVREGIPVQDALERASCFLSVARDLCYQASSDSDSSQASGAAYLVELAKGLLDASIRPLTPPSQSAPKDEPVDWLSFLREALADSQKQAGQARTAKMRTYHDGRASAFQIAIAALEG